MDIVDDGSTGKQHPIRTERERRLEAFERARDIILQDTSIPIEEKEGILKLIHVLSDAALGMFTTVNDATIPITREIVSKHSLLTLVKQQADELDALRKLSINLTSSLNLLTVLDSVINEAMRLIKNARTAHIFLYTNNKLEFGAALHADGSRNAVVAMPRSEGLTYTVAQTGEMLVVENMANHPLYKNVPSDARWVGSIIGIPLKMENKVVGVMNLSRSTMGGFTPAELRLLSLLSDQAAVAISNASLHQLVSKQALSDTVTGLPNRRALDERLEEETLFARRTNSKFAVVMMDLDGFKAINDTHGHAVGDEALRSVFNYLAEGMRSTDFLARYGGDELTMVLRQTDVEMAKEVTDRILEKIKAYAFTLEDGTNIKLGLSGGIAVYPTHADNSAYLLRAADAALYQAKKHHRGSFVLAKKVTGPLNPITLPKKIA